MEEAKQTTNPVRLFFLGLNVRDALERALEEKPHDAEVRLDLVRFHMTAPRIVGGDRDKAPALAREIAQRDAALGHFARGYIAYRDGDFGLARSELRDAVAAAKADSTRLLALRWLGWLSQESQQYEDAFATWDRMRAEDPAALYEIGRTAVFCSCRLEQGRVALQQYMRSKRSAEMPTLAAAHLQLGLVHEKLGDLRAARREVETAWKLDRELAGVAAARKRLR